jgi:hypothetical protein
VILVILIVIVIQKITRYYNIYIYDIKIWDREDIDSGHTSNVVLYNSYNKGYMNKEFVKLNSKILRNFCNKNNHQYRQMIHEDSEMSPYWTRVKDLYELCNSYPDGTLIMYLDADAIITSDNINIGVDKFIKTIDEMNKNTTKSIYISEDPLSEWSLFYNGIFNTGCFIVRNNPESRKFVKEWLSIYDKNFKWEADDDGKWSCTINSTECLWADSGYEQGEFTKLYNEKYKYLIQYLHWSTLACQNLDNKNHYVLHLMGDTDQKREKIFTDQYKKLMDQ